MIILGIETSCDETSAAVTEDGRYVLSCVISSSKSDFMHLSGVIPENAARKQLISILPVIGLALRKANITPDSLDAIAVSSGPGLLGSLLIGTSTARVLAKIWNKPLIAVHHTLGHLSSTWLKKSDAPPAHGGSISHYACGVVRETPRSFYRQSAHSSPLRQGLSAKWGKNDSSADPVFPILTLSVSGGHTELWHRKSHTSLELIGATRDDAAGEAFDKGASLLGLPYPGGPELEKAATRGDSTKFVFPIPFRNDKTCDFSFSGLKTSLKYLLRGMTDNKISKERPSISAAYQLAICSHLKGQIKKALIQLPDIRELHIVGGVSANKALKRMLEPMLKAKKLILRTPVELRYSTDNAAMIAAAGFFLVQEKPGFINRRFSTMATWDLKSSFKN